jgi:hypothetical protein
MENPNQEFFNLGNKVSEINMDSCVSKACLALKKLITSQTDKSLFDNRHLLSKISSINFVKKEKEEVKKKKPLNISVKNKINLAIKIKASNVLVNKSLIIRQIGNKEIFKRLETNQLKDKKENDEIMRSVQNKTNPSKFTKIKFNELNVSDINTNKEVNIENNAKLPIIKETIALSDKYDCSSTCSGLILDKNEIMDNDTSINKGEKENYLSIFKENKYKSNLKNNSTLSTNKEITKKEKLNNSNIKCQYTSKLEIDVKNQANTQKNHLIIVNNSKKFLYKSEHDNILSVKNKNFMVNNNKVTIKSLFNDYPDFPSSPTNLKLDKPKNKKKEFNYHKNNKEISISSTDDLKNCPGSNKKVNQLISNSINKRNKPKLTILASSPQNNLNFKKDTETIEINTLTSLNGRSTKEELSLRLPTFSLSTLETNFKCELNEHHNNNNEINNKNIVSEKLIFNNKISNFELKTKILTNKFMSKNDKSHKKNKLSKVNNINSDSCRNNYNTIETENSTVEPSQVNIIKISDKNFHTIQPQQLNENNNHINHTFNYIEMNEMVVDKVLDSLNKTITKTEEIKKLEENLDVRVLLLNNKFQHAYDITHKNDFNEKEHSILRTLGNLRRADINDYEKYLAPQLKHLSGNNYFRLCNLMIDDINKKKYLNCNDKVENIITNINMKKKIVFDRISNTIDYIS